MAKLLGNLLCWLCKRDNQGGIFHEILSFAWCPAHYKVKMFRVTSFTVISPLYQPINIVLYSTVFLRMGEYQCNSRNVKYRVNMVFLVVFWDSSSKRFLKDGDHQTVFNARPDNRKNDRRRLQNHFVQYSQDRTNALGRNKTLTIIKLCVQR